MGGLWKLPQPWKSNKVAFGNILLDDFPPLLGKPCWVFHSYHKPDDD
jgi:hypothetical protein